jgi:asparaginyl-tRNA synthetase
VRLVKCIASALLSAQRNLKTRRHLIEFWMVEPEVAFNDMYDNMDLAEQFVEYIVQRVLKNRAEELKVLERDTTKLSPIIAPFPKLHYKEAVEIILKENPAFVVGDDFGAPDETIVSSNSTSQFSSITTRKP